MQKVIVTNVNKNVKVLSIFKLQLFVFMEYKLKNTRSCVVTRYQPSPRCAICQLPLRRNCVDHYDRKRMVLAHTSDDMKTYYKMQQENLFNFLMQLRDCVAYRFSVFPKDMIQYITKMVPMVAQLKKTCPIIFLDCRHSYHNHCWKKWIKKRNCCPLCNRKSRIVYIQKYFDAEIKSA